MLRFLIRDERPSDVETISDVTRTAFLGHPYGARTEHLIVEALRDAGALSISLVAELDGRVVGHVAFSRVAVSDGSTEWYGLGPVSVLPELQRRGVGSALIRTGLDRLRARDARGCVLLGNPAYYARFGFAHDPKLVLAGVPPEYFQALAFGGTTARGEVTYHSAFDVEIR